MFWRLVSMRCGPPLGPQRGLVVPGRPLQDPRAMCPQISAPWSSFGRACPPTSEGLLTVCHTSTASPLTAAVTPLYFRRGRGSDTPQPAPFLPAIFQPPESYVGGRTAAEQPARTPQVPLATEEVLSKAGSPRAVSDTHLTGLGRSGTERYQLRSDPRPSRRYADFVLE
ncbi:hypothetical protein NDU88_008065 [Pleurodeles waltl]|uniref:Uncharacterized protein n=1 Tax=Pleurodeles waltl TaxID=8319 RepID=A0AAV7VU12_PLEWA|nr:hypothetical protein NDU88_008065 [Pleurodeles waltl]